MLKLIPTNDVEIQINAKSKGDFGFMSIGGMERTPKEEYRICEDIVSQIKRHVDDVGWTGIQQKQLYETEDGEQFDTLYEALEHLYDEGSVIKYVYRYSRPSDNGTGTRGMADTFQSLIETAWNNPWSFTVIGGMDITQLQQEFLDRVIEKSLEAKVPKEANQHAQTT